MDIFWNRTIALLQTTNPAACLFYQLLEILNKKINYIPHIFFKTIPLFFIIFHS